MNIKNIKNCIREDWVLGSISSTLKVRIFRTNVVFLLTFWLCQKIRMKNARVKRWWNWHLGLISPICLHPAFICTYPRNAKRQPSHQCLFALLGSLHAKTAVNFLMKLSPGHNLLSNHFSELLKVNFSISVEISCGDHLQWSISSTFFVRILRTKVCSKPNTKERKDVCTKKCARKTLMKLTPHRFLGSRLWQANCSW